MPGSEGGRRQTPPGDRPATDLNSNLIIRTVAPDDLACANAVLVAVWLRANAGALSAAAVVGEPVTLRGYQVGVLASVMVALADRIEVEADGEGGSR